MTDDKTWSLNQGGTGFAPPYVFPKPGGSINSPEGSGRGSVGNRDLLTPSSTNAASVSARETTYDQSRARHIKAKNSYVESLASHNSRPATVFCSRELENGLVRAVERGVEQTGHVPSAGALRAHARAILGPGVDSPADDPDLMDRFQRMMLAKMPHARLPLSEEEEARQKERDEERGRGRQRERREESVPAFLLEGQELSDRELEDLAMGMDIDAQMGGGGANLWL